MFYNTYSEKCETILFFVEQSQTNTSCLPGCVNTSDHSDPIVTSGESWCGRKVIFFFCTITSGPAALSSSCVLLGHVTLDSAFVLSPPVEIILLRLGTLSKTHILDGHIVLIGAKLASAHS